MVWAVWTEGRPEEAQIVRERLGLLWALFGQHWRNSPRMWAPMTLGDLADPACAVRVACNIEASHVAQ